MKKYNKINPSFFELFKFFYLLVCKNDAEDGLANFLSIVNMYPLPNLFFKNKDEPQHCNLP
jgi:hypothetical protein